MNDGNREYLFREASSQTCISYSMNNSWAFVHPRPSCCSRVDGGGSDHHPQFVFACATSGKRRVISLGTKLMIRQTHTQLTVNHVVEMAYVSCHTLVCCRSVQTLCRNSGAVLFATVRFVPHGTQETHMAANCAIAIFSVRREIHSAHGWPAEEL